MHTFFVNTSKRSLNYYDILFDICHENMNLVSFDYPISEWYSPDKGYVACANKMASEIDSNSEITNDFNLIVYIDLCEIRQYIGIPREDARNKAVFLRALRMLYLHVINETLVKYLDLDGRAPASTLVMLGEDISLDSHFEKDSTDRIREDITKTMMGFFGIPTEADIIADIARPICDSDEKDKLSMLRDKIGDLSVPTKIHGAHEAYNEFTTQWYQDIIEFMDVDNAFKNLNQNIEKKFNLENLYSKVKWVSCPCDNYAISRNKSAHAIVQLSIACYLAECVYSESLLADNGVPREFVLCDAARLAGILAMRKQTYASKMAQIEKLSKTYSSLKLAPELYEFDNEKFALDEHGNRIHSYEEEKIPEDEKEKSEEEPSRLVKKEKEGELLFAPDEFAPFSYRGDELISGVNPGGKDPNKYRLAAKKIKEHHASYLTKLREHVKSVLANYACDSTGNYQAILRKRSVSVADSDFTDFAKDYKYAPLNKPIETKKIEVVEDNSKRAYESAVMRYLEFCAGRSVAVTDIEEQFEWINRRINEIEASLKKLKIAGIGTLLSLLLLYTPFVIIQWESIIANVITLSVALCSMAAPIVLLAIVYMILAAFQKDKYNRAWKIFKAKSDEVLKENADAALMYDRLLAEIIPALRWIYEYKLDVDFHIDCCRLAKAKVEHHATKLRERVSVIGNIIEDLEVSNIPQLVFEAKLSEDIDLNVSYCTGAKNIGYYSILNQDLLKSLRGGKEI